MYKMKSNWKYYAVSLFFLALIAFFVRVVNLTTLPVFADEAIYIRWSQIMQADSTLRFLPLSDGKQPLFMWITIPFFKIFDDPLFAGRFVSVLSGVATVAGVYTLSFLLFKRNKLSLVSASIAALSPFLVFFDRMALVDSLLSALGIWISVFAVLTVKTKRLDAAMITGGLLGLSLLTKSPAIFFAILLPFALVFFNFDKSKRFTQILKILGLYITVYFIAFCIQNILRLGPNFHLLSSRNGDYVYPFSHVFERPLDPFIPYIHRAFEWYWMLGAGALIFLILIGIYNLFFKSKRELFFLLCLGLIPILATSEFAKVYTARYILYTVPYFCILAGLAFLSQSFLKRVTYVAFVAFLIQAITLNYHFLTDPSKAALPAGERSGYLEEWTSGTGIYEVSEYLKSEYEKDKSKKFVVGTEGYFGTLPDGLQIYLNEVPEITVIGVGLDLKELPQSLRESRNYGNETYLVINDSRLKVDYEKIGLTKILSFPKSNRQIGTKEYNLLGERESLYLFKVQ